MAKKILIVDDEEIFREQYTASFQKSGFEPIAVSNKTQALKSLQHDTFAACILDVNLSPEAPFEGFDLLQTIHQQYPAILTFIVTGTALDAIDQYRALTTLNADDYILKPIDSGVLAAKVMSVLRRHEWLQKPSSIQYYCYDNLEIDFLDETVTYKTLTLFIGSPERSTILRVLAEMQGKVVLYEKLWEVLKGENSEFTGEPEPEVIQKTTYNINKRLKEVGFKENLITTVRGKGMKIPRSNCNDKQGLIKKKAIKTRIKKRK